MRETRGVRKLRVGPGLRVARGAVAAAVAVGLGLAAHVAAGGLLPSAAWVLLIFGGVATVTVASMGGPAGLLRLVALVGGGQFATHAMLTALAGHGGDHGPVRARVAQVQESIAGVSSGRRGSLHDLTMGRLEPTGSGEVAVPHWMTHVLDDMSGPHAAMAVAHFAAASIVAWWLAQGEHALWTVLVLLGSTAAHALSRLVAMYAVHPPSVRSAPVRAGGAQRPCRLLASLTGGPGRRGPPPIAI